MENDWDKGFEKVKFLINGILENSSPQDKDRIISRNIYSYKGTDNLSSRSLATQVNKGDFFHVELQLNGYLIPYADIELTFFNREIGKSVPYKTKIRQPDFPFVFDQVSKEMCI